MTAMVGIIQYIKTRTYAVITTNFYREKCYTLRVLEVSQQQTLLLDCWAFGLRPSTGVIK